MLNLIAVILCGICSRLDGWGKRDGFLPFKPFSYLKYGGINYARYAIPVIVYCISHNILSAVLFGVAVSVPWGEKHWHMKFGLWSWAFIGLLWSMGSLNPFFMVWFAGLVAITKFYDMNWAIMETFVFGMGSTAFLLFN